MRKLFYAAMSTLSAVVLAGSYYVALHDSSTQTAEAPEQQSSPTATGSTSQDSTPQDAASSGQGSSTNDTSTNTDLSSGLQDGTYTGDVEQTRYGAVQVAITVSNGTIADVQVPQFPEGGGRTDRINASAVPLLVDETLSAQSANIDMVSGATYTTDGYVASLQSALDQAQA